MTPSDTALADAWRAHWSRLIGLLIGQFARPDLAEDAVSDAFESAARHWPVDGVPTNTGAWLLTAARRRVLDRLRSEAVQRRKEPLMVVDDEMRAAAAAAVDPGAHVADEQLRLIFACCHPAIAPDDRVALTLRFVVGLTTTEIGRLLLVQESTMAARLTRAKKRLASSGIPFATPAAARLDERLDVVATVVYLAFTSGYHPGEGAVPLRVDLGDEAIRLLRVLDDLLPDRAVVRSLLALLLLQHSRRDTRLDPAGALVLLPDQDRSRWHRDEIAEGVALLESLAASGWWLDRGPGSDARSAPDGRGAAGGPASPLADAPRATPTSGHQTRLATEYRLQALIAAEHATAPTVRGHPLVRHRRPLRPARGAHRLPGRPAGPRGGGVGGVGPGGRSAAAGGPRRRPPPPPPGPRRPRRAPHPRRPPHGSRRRLPSSPVAGDQPHGTHPPAGPPGRPGRPDPAELVDSAPSSWVQPRS